MKNVENIINIIIKKIKKFIKNIIKYIMNITKIKFTNKAKNFINFLSRT